MKTLRALCLHRPWAWAIAHGTKRCENRTWAPPDDAVGELLAIHAGKKWDEAGARIIAETLDYTIGILPESAYDEGIVAVARLSYVIRPEDEDVADAHLPWIARDKFGWVLDGVTPIRPFRCRGFQRLWRLPEDIHEIVMARYIAAGGVLL